MSAQAKEPFLEEHWMFLVIAFGVLLTALFTFYGPLVPGQPNEAERQGTEQHQTLRTDGTRDAPTSGEGHTDAR